MKELVNLPEMEKELPGQSLVWEDTSLYQETIYALISMEIQRQDLKNIIFWVIYFISNYLKTFLTIPAF